MALWMLLLLSGILESVAAQDPVVDNDNDDIIKPIHYTIKIAPDNIKNFFYGECNVSFLIDHNTRNITLNSENIFINRVTLITKLKQVADYVLTPTKLVFKGNNTFTLYFDTILLHGQYILNIPFYGRINNNNKGLFRVPFINSNRNVSWILTTNNLLTGAREVFPCVDDPTVKATFDISIRHHKSEKVFSTMPAKYYYSDSLDNDIVWTHFHRTPPISTYELTILIISSFTNIVSTSVNSPVIQWARRNVFSLPKNLQDDGFHCATAVKVMSFFQSKFGELKIQQINFIALPGFQYDTIATLGLVLHREEDIMFDNELPITSVVQKNNICRFVARQIALQWFIGSIKPSVWSYQWFNAVAEFFGIYALDKISDTSKMMNWFVVHTVHDSLHLDVDNLMEPITGKRNTPTNSTHFRVPPFIKVSALLRMVEYVLGEVFWNNTRSYLLNEPLLSNNIWICFLRHLRTQSFSNFHSCTLYWRWIQTSNYPLLSIEQRNVCEYLLRVNNGLNTTERYSKNQFWFILNFNYLYEIRSTKSKEFNGYFSVIHTNSSSILLQGVNNKECLPVVNVNQNGYYRVKYEYEKWKHPVIFIDAFSYKNLSVLNRAQIIDDEYHIYVQRKYSLSIFLLHSMRYLNTENEYEAWLPMIRFLEDMSTFLPISDNETVIVFKQLLAPALIGLVFRNESISDNLNSKDSFQSCLHYEAFKWACLLDSSRCYLFAVIELDDFIDAIIHGRRNTSHANLWQEWIYCDGLRNKTLPELEKIILNSKFKNNFNDAFVKYIPCLGFTLALQFLHIKDTTYKTFLSLQDPEHVILFQSLVAKHSNNHMKEILENFSVVKPRTMKPTTALCIIINHVYSTPLLHKIIFFVQSADVFIGHDGFRNIDPVMKKIELRESQLKKQKNKFLQVWGTLNSPT